MNETKNNKKQTLGILGLVALILVLFLGIKVIFAGLDRVMPRPEPSPYTALTDEDGQSVPYGLRLLEAEEVQAQEVQSWLEQALDAMDRGSADGENSAFWLYRQDTDEYLLYLPGQDRSLSPLDVTAAEERDGDGEITLALRARTPEGGREVRPEEQLLCIRTQSEQWRGIRVKVVLDGRERYVHKLTLTRQGRFYSADETYIGRF